MVFFLTVLVSATGTAFAAEGIPDLSFGSSGVVTFNRGSNDAAHAVALQIDGKKVIAGTISNGSNTDVLILRLNNDGTPDTTFGTNGARVFDSGNNDAARGVVVQADGKIVVVGQISNGTDTDILVLRRNANGTPDLTFNLIGRAVFDLSDNDTANAVAIQTTGSRIVIAGTTSNGADNDLLIMRLNSNGAPDTTFGLLGIVTIDRGANDTGRAVAVQLNGIIVAAGTSSNGLNRDLMVVRVTASGAQDTSFSSDGIAIIDRGGNEAGNAVAVEQLTGSIFVAGTGSNDLDTDLMVVKLTASGVPDGSFNGDGIRIIDRGGDDSGNAVVLQTNGKIVVTGSSSNGVDLDLIVMRLDSIIGALDATFSTNGIAVFGGTADGDDSGNAVAVQTDGKVIVAGARSGNLNSDIMVLRYTSAGVLDTTFSTDGVSTFRGKANTADAGNAVALQANGKIVVAGQTSNGDNNDALVLRFNPDGTRDTVFSTDGVVVFDGDGNGDDAAKAVAIQAVDGRIVVAGQTSNGFNSDVLIMRFNKDGTPDTAFSADGVVTFNGTANGEDSGNAVAVQTDGKIVVVGQSSNGVDNDVIVLRYNANGVLDTTFSTDGVVIYDGGNNDRGRAVAVQADGKIIVVGQSSNEADNDVIVLRLDANGSLDPAFGTGGVATYDSGNNDAGGAVALQADGATVIAGQRSNGVKNIVLLARFTSAGVLDATFSSNGIAGFNSGNPGDDIGHAVEVQADGKIVVAGTTDGADLLILRYLDSGVLDTSFNENPEPPEIGNGVVVYDGAVGGIDAGRGIAIQSDGKIVVAGEENDDVLVLRYIGQKVRVLTPNGGEVVAAGSTLANYITWTAPPKAVTFTIELSLDGGTTWKTVATNVAGTVLSSWTVPAPINNKTQCLVRVTGFDAVGVKVNADRSDAVFTIEVVKLTFPNGGNVFTSGDPVTITWTTNATKRPVASVRLSYTLNNGVSWKPIDTSADSSDDGTFAWAAPPVTVTKNRVRVKVVLKDMNNVTLGSDKSDAKFRIEPGP
jgi:uncharacterized delta-60 repeat protein